jgi:hypothetical protein
MILIVVNGHQKVSGPAAFGSHSWNKFTRAVFQTFDRKSCRFTVLARSGASGFRAAGVAGNEVLVAIVQALQQFQ